MSTSYQFETLTVHGGHTPDRDTLSRAVPIYRTSSYMFQDTQHAADLFALKTPGNIYTRLGNPTQEILENRLAQLHGAPAALALASGTSAIFYTIINTMGQGGHIVSGNNLYGGTYSMFESILPQFGISVSFVDPHNPAAVAAAVKANTRALFIETIGNPVLDVPDFDAIGRIAQENRVPLVVDDTFATPALFNPLDHGAHIVVHSLTKWIGGHGTGIGGIVVDGGTFDWSDERFSLYNTPDPSYHGIRWGHDLGDQKALAFILRMRTVPLRNLGACISPDNAWLFLQGLETLHLRMERHCANAQAVAEHLVGHKKVTWVRYPGLKNDPAYENAAKYLSRGAGGMVVFGVKGGADAGARFIDGLQLISHLANVGDAKSLAIHPASTTHSQLSEEEQRAGGLTPELIRLSIGIEHIDDIIADLDHSLAAV